MTVVEGATTGVTLRDLTPADVGAAAALSRANGWNQVEADWEFLLGANPGRFVAAERDGVLVGTGGASCYTRRLAWVCMILVDAGQRGHGVGAAIVSAVLERASDMQTVGLDATPSGRPVYERLGFVAGASLARMEGRLSGAAAVSADVQPVTAAELDVIVGLDPEAFGADRGAVIRWAHERAPDLAWCVKDKTAVLGYCFGRHGDRAAHIGPVIAQDVAGARALVARAAASVAERDVIVDVPTAIPGWVDALRGLGFREQRPFTRMYRAGARPPGWADLVFAAFGPELG